MNEAEVHKFLFEELQTAVRDLFEVIDVDGLAYQVRDRYEGGWDSPQSEKCGRAIAKIRKLTGAE